MAQVLQDKGWVGGLSELLGQGISGGLNNLVQGKIESMQRKQENQRWNDTLTKAGYTPEEAGLAGQFKSNPKALAQILTQLSAAKSQQEAGPEQYSQMSGNQGQNVQQMFQNQGQPFDVNARGPQNGMQNLQDILNQYAQGNNQQQQQQQPSVGQNNPVRRPSSQPRPKGQMTPAQLLGQSTSNGKQLNQLDQEKLKKIQLENAQKQEEIALKKHTNNQIVKNVKHLLQLAKGGNVVNGVEGWLSKGFTPAQTKDTQKYSKELETLVGLIEGRVTDFRIKQMLKQLPNLEVDNDVKIEMLQGILDGLIGKQGILAGDYGDEKKKSIGSEGSPENAPQAAFQAATLNNQHNGPEDTPENNQQGDQNAMQSNQGKQKGLFDRITGLPGLIGRNALASMMGGWGDILNESSGGKLGLKGTQDFLGMMGENPEELSAIEKSIGRISQIAPSFYAGGSSPLGALAGATGTELGSSLGGALGGETGSAIGGALGSMGASALVNRPSAKTVDKYARDAFEKDKAARIKDLVKTNDHAERSLLKESSKLSTAGKKLSEKTPINKAQKELKAYDKKIKENYQQMKPLYEQAAKHEESGKFSASSINKEATKVNDNFAKGMSTTDMVQLEKIIRDIETTTQSTAKDPAGKLSIGDAKILKRNINNQIFDKNSSSVFRENAGKIVSSVNDFITKNNNTKHNKPWRKAEGLYKEAAKLKSGQKEFVSDQKQHIKELSREQQIAESAHKSEVKQHQQVFKATEIEHRNAIKAIGKENYDKLLKDKTAQERLQSNIEKLAKGVNKFGGALFGTALGQVLPGGKIVTPIVAQLIHSSYNEIKRVRQAFKDHPKLYRKTMQLIKDATRRSIPTLISKVNKLGKEIEDKS
jgi:hypothetical protein